MQINWCFKGITESGWFSDAEASAVLSQTGILSTWMLANSAAPLNQANIDVQSALNANALDNHVNFYGLVAGNTPYISLSAGCREYAGPGSVPIRYAALRTAFDFATNGGRVSGYVFRCWVITGLKPAPELPGFAEEIRDLNLFANFYQYHDEGEVTAKVIVPRRQVNWVLKIGPNLLPVRATWTPVGGPIRAHRNPDFVWPDRVSNIIEAIY
jgi:hypothetical protein